MKEWTPDQLELARRMKALGAPCPAEPGTYVWTARRDDALPRTPFQQGVHLVVWPGEFLAAVGGPVAFARDFVWLPCWEDGCAWLRAMGVPHKHIYYVVKEGVMFYNENERTLLYGEILRILEVESAKADEVRRARTAP